MSTLAPLTSSYTVIEFQPLTTEWSIPDACTTDYVASAGSGWSTMSVFWPQYGQYVDSSLQCLPSAATTSASSSLNLDSSTVTSLGPFVCPSGWTMATTQESQLGSLTMTMCCPSNWGKNLNGGDPTVPGKCHSIMKTSELTYAVKPTDSASLSYPWPMTTRKDIKANIIIQGYPVWGYNQGSAPASSGLSTGAKAGIGVGVAVGALILLALLAFWFLRHRKRKQAAAEVPLIEVDPGVAAASELESKHDSKLPAEADSRAGDVELEQKTKLAPYEAAELQAGGTGLRWKGQSLASYGTWDERASI
ncbi:hypothetical protein N7470_004887 [Penicillium chermesinum]|nr:hypothetical protein N7470_004887 [Penicillium chermesinum]